MRLIALIIRHLDFLGTVAAGVSVYHATGGPLWALVTTFAVYTATCVVIGGQSFGQRTRAIADRIHR